jgi:hypothetical protein
MAILPTSLRKVEPQTGTDLPRSGIEIEATDSSKHQRPAVEHVQHLPVFGRYTGAGSTHGPWGNRCVQRCPRCAGVHASSSCRRFADNLAFHQAPQRRFRADFISTWSLGSTLAVKEITQRWCNCLQPGPSSQVARVVVQNMMAVAGRSGWCRAEEGLGDVN